MPNDACDGLHDGLGGGLREGEGDGLRVLVTRPEQDAAHWVLELSQNGFDALALPLIEIAAASSAVDANALHATWYGLADYAACMFVSSHAVHYFFETHQAADQVKRAQATTNSIALSGVDTVPAGVRFMAPGPGTAAALVAAGVPVGQIDSPPLDAAQFDSKALWRVMGQRDWRAKKVLVVRGQSDAAAEGSANGNSVGRDWLAQQWRTHGARVEFLQVYQRRAPHLTAAQLDMARSASADGSVWLFSSSEAIANLRQQPALQTVNWSQSRAIATHPRIAQAARLAGWGVVQESRPALADITGALRSIELRAL